MLRIIDTSNWKADINLSQVSIDGVYTRATYGTSQVDPSCDQIVQQAINLGKVWGVYHFACSNFSDAVTQANFFVDNCLGYVGKGMLVLDWERENNDVSNVGWALEWLRHVYARTGVRPLIYMSQSVLNEADWSPVSHEDYGLIVANYWWNYDRINDFGADAFPNPQVNWVAPNGVNVQNVMWQFTSSGYLSGYGGALDCNWFYGDVAMWNAYANVLTVPVPAPEQTTPAPSPDPTPVVEPEPIPAPVPDPVVVPEPVPEPVVTEPTPPKVIVPDPSEYYKIWQLLVAAFKRFIKYFKEG